MAKLFSMPKVSQPAPAPARAPDPPPAPAPEPRSEPGLEPGPDPEPGPAPAGGPEPDADPALLRPVSRERGRIGTVATSWRGVLSANGGLPRRKSLLGE
jgi:hypothetical protein